MIKTISRLKKSGKPSHHLLRCNPVPRIFAFSLVVMGSPLLAAPAGEQIVAGAAAVSRPDSNLTLIHQTSQNAVINWQSFDIGAAEAVRFQQPSASAIALNRVMGQSPTQILGVLTANGQVFVLNPNGVLFGSGTQVNVGGLVASTLNLATDDFMAGRLQFTGSGATGEVRNAGDIIANGGYVALLGSRVSNDGSIVASDVALAAGDKLDLKLNGNRLVSLTVDQGAINALAHNRGLIRADGGQVLLTAKAADHLIKSVVNNSGIIEAATLRNVNGRLRLDGDLVTNSGTLSSRGNDGQRGGSVELLGNRVALLDGAVVDVSGSAGGGTALIGGDFQGGNSAIQNAERSHVAASASIKADALDTGDGGKVVVWADGDTRFLGSISAKGGATGGNGGLVEVSGKQDLDMRGRIDVAAPQGIGGNVLLDPQNIVLNTSTQNSPSNSANGTPDVAFATAPAAGTYTIQIADITGYNELYLQATNNITLANALAMTSGNSVRFEAGNTIALNAALTASGGVNLSAANVTSATAGTITTTGATAANAGNITINATGNVALAGSLTASGGTASAASSGRNGGIISIAGAGVSLGAAAITANGSAGSGASQTGGAGGAINITSTNGISGTGAITASGGSGGTGPSAGGAGGAITLINNNAGNMSVGALSARSGNALTTGTGGAAGSIAATNNATGGSLSTGAITTTGGNNGHGGLVSINSSGALTTGAIATSGGAANSGTSGRNAGAIALTGQSISTGSNTITAAGSAGVGTSQNGGNGASIQLSSTGAITTGAINSVGGAGTTTLANGGNAGSIIVTNNSTTTGAIALGALTSTSGAAFGAGTGGTAGAVQIINNAAGQNLSTGAITANGGTNSNGANVDLAAQGNVAIAGLINTNGGARGTGSTAAGTNAGSIAISGVDRSVTGAITATGGAGLGTNQAGGNAGTVSITGSGTLTTGAINAQTGAATGTGVGGTAGGIALTGSAVGTGALAINGSNNGNGGTVTINSAGALATGTIATGGGTANAGTYGRNAGAVTLTAGGPVTGVGAITANGSTGVLTGDQAGGNGAAISITGAGGLTASTITASGGAAVGTNANGGNAGSITLANSGSGNIGTGALIAQTGAAAGSGAGGSAGFVSATNTATSGNLTTAGINTSGGLKGHGGNINLSALGAVSTGAAGSINAAGGSSITGNAGRNAGTITLSGDSVSTGTGSITANGSAGIGTSQNGGNGAAVQISSTGAITTGAINSAGGAGTTTLANGGNAGSIIVTNNSTTTGAIALGGLTSNSGAAFGAGTGGTAGAVQITNNAAGQNLATGAITANGGTNGNGANVDLAAQGNVAVAGLINTNGGVRGTGSTAAGTSAGAVAINGVNRSVTGAITAVGGAGLGTNQAGGNAGLVSITGSGTLTAGAISSQTGAATGTGAGGVAGGITLAGTTVGTGALTTTGGSNGHGGAVAVSATGAMVTGAIAASGGVANSGTAGRNAGAITLLGDSVSTGASTISATGSAGVGTSQNGGSGANVQIATTGAITAGAISTAGGAGTTSLANGGSAGSIIVANNSTTTGAVTLGAVTSNSGAAFAIGTGGTAGTVQITNQAVGQNLSTGAITASGGTNSNGANVALASQGNVTVSGLITTNGGARGTGSTAAGTNAGTIAISGVNRSVTGALTAVGGAGLGTNQAGGNAGGVSMTGSGTLTTAAITSQSGAATGTGTGGTAAGISLAGTTVGTGALTTTGAANGAGGNIGVTSGAGNIAVGAIATGGGAANTNVAGRNAGSVSLNSAGQLVASTINAGGSTGSGANQAGGAGGAVALTAANAITIGAITASGGNAGSSGNANGGAGGSITLDAGGATPNINLGGGITAVGGNRIGTGVAGAGGGFWAKDATTNTANVTINTAGGTTGGAGGSIRFDGPTNEDATARTLTLTAGTGAVTLTGGTPTNAVTTLTATGSSINLGSIQTKGAQSYTGATNLNGALLTTGTAGADNVTFNSPVSLTGNSSITTAGGSGDNIAVGQTINGNFNLALDAGAVGNVTTSAVIGGVAPLASFSATGGAVTFGRSVTAGSIFARSTSGNITLNTAGTVLAGTGTGNAVELVVSGAAGRFVNSVGAGAINASNSAGRFLIWSQSPASDTRGGLTFNFKQYGATYGATSVADADFNHNGFLSTAAPVINVGLTGAVTKTYDGSDAAALTGANYTVSGAIDGDTVTLNNPAAGTYIDKHAGSAKTVTANGLAINSATNGAATVYGYSLASTSAAANIGTINQRALTVSAQSDSRVYDATTASTVAPIVTGTLYDTVTTAATQSFDTKHVGNNKTLTASGLVLNDGNSGNNYAVNYVANTTGVISKADLSVNAVSDTKVYDATISSSGVVTTSGLQSGDSVTGATQEFANKNVLGSNGSTLQVSGYTLNDGNSGENYNVTLNSAAGTINPSALTVTAQSDSRVYNGTTASTVAPVVSGTLYDSVLTAATQTFDTKNAGSNKTLTASGLVLSDGNNGNNYTVNYVADNTGTINKASLAVNATSDTKTYDSTIVSNGVVGVSGLQSGDTVTGATQQFASKNVMGSNNSTLQVANYTLNDGNNGGNYNVTVNSAAGTINPRALIVTAQSDNRVYDGTTISTSTPLVTGTLYDTVLASATQHFDTKHVGNNKTLTASGLVIDDSNNGNNYAVSYVSTTAGAITKADLNVNAASDTKVYDATISSSGVVTTSGLQSGDSVTGATQEFGNKNVLSSNGSTLQVTGFTLNDGNNGGNYNVAVNTAAGTITPATISSVSGITASDKVYDATTTAMLNTNAAVLNGVLGADVLSVVGAAGNFTDKNAGPSKAVNISGLALAGSDAGNYLLADSTASTNATIQAREIGVAANNTSKVYGNADPVLSFSFDTARLVGDETAADVFAGTLTRDTGEDVAGGPYAIRQGSLTTNSNYTITTFVPGQMTITPRPLTIAADNKVGVSMFSLPRFTANYSGFAFADSPASLEGALIIAAPPEAMAAPGIYVITPSGQSSSNYAVNYVCGTLLVAPAEISVIEHKWPAIYSADEWLQQMSDPQPSSRHRKAAAGCGKSAAPGSCASNSFEAGGARLNIIGGGMKLPAGLSL